MKDRRCERCGHYKNHVGIHTCMDEPMSVKKFEWMQKNGCIYVHAFVEKLEKQIGEGSEVEKWRTMGW